MYSWLWNFWVQGYTYFNCYKTLSTSPPISTRTSSWRECLLSCVVIDGCVLPKLFIFASLRNENGILFGFAFWIILRQKFDCALHRLLRNSPLWRRWGGEGGRGYRGINGNGKKYNKIKINLKKQSRWSIISNLPLNIIESNDLSFCPPFEE